MLNIRAIGEFGEKEYFYQFFLVFGCILKKVSKK